MKTIRIIAAFVVGGMATSNLLVWLIPPAAVAPMMVPHDVAAKEVAPPEATAPDPVPDPVPVPPIEAVPAAPSSPAPFDVEIVAYAAKYGVSAPLMRRIIECETANTFDPKIQSFVRYAYSRPAYGIVKGDRERSFGLAQIHLPDNPRISYEQATDPDFALNFMASEIAAGNTWRWKACYAESRS